MLLLHRRIRSQERQIAIPRRRPDSDSRGRAWHSRTGQGANHARHDSLSRTEVQLATLVPGMALERATISLEVGRHVLINISGVISGLSR